jgi:hypothetical protein
MTTGLLIELDRTRYLKEKKNGIVWSKGTCFIDFCLFCRLKFETGIRLIKLDFHICSFEIWKDEFHCKIP